MRLPNLNADGELPIGVHRSTIKEVIRRFGSGTTERQEAANRLHQIWELAKSTGHLQRIVIFGSFITSKAAPNDVDIILIMDGDYRVEDCDDEAAVIFDHVRTQRDFGASVFWIRPGLLINDTLEMFIQRWQRKRDGGQRGIIEVLND